MAGQPIKITLDVDTQRAATDLRRFADQLDEVADSTKDTDKAMSNAARTLAGDLRRDLDRAEQSASDLSRTFDRDLTGALKDSSRQAKRTGDDIARETKDGTRKASDNVREFKNEATQNFAETASSFDGSMGSIVDLAQSTFGGSASSLAGPVALGAGLLAGIGGALYTSITENAAKSEQRIQDMFDAMLDAQTGYLSQSYIEDELAKIVKGADDAKISWKEAGDVAKETGLTQSEVAAAYAGDADAAAKLTAALNDEVEKHDRAISNATSSNELWGQILVENGAKVEAMNKRWQANQRDVAKASSLIDDYRSTVATMSDSYKRQMQANVEQTQALEAAVANLGQRSITISAKVDESGLRRSIERSLAGTYTVKVNGRRVGQSYE